MYEIVIDRCAEKQLAKIPAPHFNRIVKAISALSNDPREDQILTVFIIDIGDRKNIYE